MTKSLLVLSGLCLFIQMTALASLQAVPSMFFGAAAIVLAMAALIVELRKDV